ncbi:PREDICTED: uncharacterized protein LOC106107704 isoform X2 [Papilio polytes]|uniref:uncharacterized protein LOC106107704 isoform X2 n=1 Tax=Papilio polytes TaxID=76194 RepID=UPI00067653F0|nr:PREDICTED: uncharacterized protein LOC106107704 isoform X2 [Papilio polytes]
MSEQDKKSNPPPLGGPSVLVVDQTQGSRQKQSFRATELQQEASELHHKRSHAFGVPSVGEELKDICQEANGSTDPDNKEQKEPKGQDVVSNEIQKQMLTKKLSSSHKKHDPPETIQYETITLAPVNVENKIEFDTKTTGAVSGAATPQPIPSATAKEPAPQPTELQPQESQPPDSKTQEAVTVVVKEECIKEDIPEQPKTDIEKKQSDWSYMEEEQAGGLPREKRSSRVSRSMRTFFCCGVPYETPSEDDVSVENYVSGI